MIGAANSLNTINTVIIEDDRDSLALLKGYITSRLPEINIVGEAGTVELALPVLKATRPQLVFMDIELPDGTAFELLDRLLPVDFGIIFITAYDKYSLKAIRYSALDYLQKPLDTDELVAAFQKAKEKVSQVKLNERLDNLLRNLEKNTHRIALPVKEGFDFVNVEDIVRCEAVNNYTSLFINSGKKYVCSRTAKEFEELLPEHLFFRVHYSHIVNINFVKKYYKSGRGGYVELSDGTTVEVAYRRKDEFLAKFGH